MSDPVLDEARLAAIQAAADEIERWKGDPTSHGIRRHDAAVRTSAAALPRLLAHVGVLRADNQRLRDEKERLTGFNRQLTDDFNTMLCEASRLQDLLAVSATAVEDALAAARAEREKIAQAIADERANISNTDLRHDEWLAGKATGLDEALALAASAGMEPGEHEHQWVNRGVQGMGLAFIGKKCSVCEAVSDGE